MFFRIVAKTKVLISCTVGFLMTWLKFPFDICFRRTKPVSTWAQIMKLLNLTMMFVQNIKRKTIVYTMYFVIGVMTLK